MQESQHRIKNIAAGEKPSKNLAIVAVQPFAAELYRVLSGEDGKIVPQLIPLEGLVDLRFEKERRAKAECGRKPHRGIGGHIGSNRRARTVFTREAEMRFIDLPGRDRGKHVGVDGIDLGRSFDTVGRVAVGGHVKSLVGIVGAIEIVRHAELIGVIYVPIVFCQQRGIANRMRDGKAFLLVPGRLKKVEQRQPLTLGVGADQSSIGGHRGGLYRTASEWSAQVGPSQILEDLLCRTEKEHLLLNDGPTDGAAELFAMKIL